jgi:hypothetical protein
MPILAAELEKHIILEKRVYNQDKQTAVTGSYIAAL